MKKLFVHSVILTCLLLVSLSQSCKKPNNPEPKDPCENKVLVTALDPMYHYWGHFSREENGGASTWLHAANWSSYSQKVMPGRQYRIAYKEVECQPVCGFKDEKSSEFCGTGNSHPLKCIEIICMEPVADCVDTMDCLASTLDEDEYNRGFTEALSGIGISGDALKVKLGYSGCGRDQIQTIRLALMRAPSSVAQGEYIFLAKAANTASTLCNAYFEDEACFDLSIVKTFLLTSNYSKAKAIIRLELRGNTTQDFVYEPSF